MSYMTIKVKNVKLVAQRAIDSIDKKRQSYADKFIKTRKKRHALFSWLPFIPSFDEDLEREKLREHMGFHPANIYGWATRDKAEDLLVACNSQNDESSIFISIKDYNELL